MNEAMFNTAHRRVRAILDEGSFMEIGGGAKSSVEDAPSDGVITGYGNIEGTPVYVYCQDADAMNGTIGVTHATKLLRVYELATKTGSPIIGMIDCAGLRLEDANRVLNEFGKLYRAAGNASGAVMQITCIMGTCGGGMALIPAMSDFVLMKNEGARFFVNSPDALEGNDIGKEDSSSAEFASDYGVVDFIGTEEEIVSKVRELIAMLPANYEDDTSYVESTDDPNRETADLELYRDDPHRLIYEIADDHRFFERRPGYCKEIITAVAKLDGTTVGFIANKDITDDDDPTAMFTPQGAYKAAYFMRFCDAFSIPVISLVNLPGFARTLESEKKIAKASARLVYNYGAATTPKISLITGDAYGSAFLTMCSRPAGVDFVYAWENAHIGMLAGVEAARMVSQRKGNVNLRLAAQEYDEKYNNIESAEAAGLVDAVIPAAETRKYLIGALRQMASKREGMPPKKHGSL